MAFLSILSGLGIDRATLEGLLARQAEDESRLAMGLPPEDFATRYQVAYRYYLERGFTPDTIPGHLSGIDFNKPVKLIMLKKGTVLQQFQTPWGRKGSYYTFPSQEIPTTLGISDRGYVSYPSTEPKKATDTDFPALPSKHAGPLLPKFGSRAYASSGKAKPAFKVGRHYEVKEDTVALCSVAASITDTWSLRGERISTEGGGIQLFCPHAKISLHAEESGEALKVPVITAETKPLESVPEESRSLYFSRFKMAYDFYLRAGYSPESIPGHLAKFDFYHPIEIIKLSAGTGLEKISGLAGAAEYYYTFPATTTHSGLTHVFRETEALQGVIATPKCRDSAASLLLSRGEYSAILFIPNPDTLRIEPRLIAEER